MDAWFTPNTRWLLFASKATDLSVGISPYGTLWFHLYAYDIAAATNRLVNLESANATNYQVHATNVVVSADSRFVAYVAFYSNPPQTSMVFRHDLAQTTLENLLITTNGQNPAISGDGSLVVYETSPLGAPVSDVYLRNIETGGDELISTDHAGLAGGNGNSITPQISPDGRYVVFASKASNLVPNDNNGCSDIFLRDRQLGVTHLLSANPKTGLPGNGPSIFPVMSADGSTVVFQSFANDLVRGDYNDKRDVFVVRLSAGDSDADGLDDAWEMAYFGSLAPNGSGDADGDGLTDAQELRAGTDPTNRGSVLRALAMTTVGGSSTTLMWPAAAGRQYRVEYKQSVNDAEWTALVAPIQVNGNTATAVDDAAGLRAQRFYRIVLVP